MARFSWEYAWAALICVLVFGAHFWLMLHQASFDDDSYFVLRQAERIAETGVPLFHDPLSYSGRTYLFPPLFPYAVALFSLAFGVELGAKITVSLCFAALSLVVYLITKHISRNRAISLISAFFSGFVPVMFFRTSGISPEPLTLVFVFLLSYFMLRIDERGFASLSLAASSLLLLASPEIFIFIFAMLFYFIILLIERQKPGAREVEMTVFLFFLSLWFYVLIYKKAFLANGIAVLWGNLPAGLLASYFQDISFIGILYSVGVIPLILGIYAIYSLAFESKNRPAQMYIGFAIASFLALWLKLIPLLSGLLFFSVSMILLCAYTLKVAYAGMQKTKAEGVSVLLAIAVVLLFIITSAPHFFTLASPAQQYPEDMAALAWIRENANESSVVIGRVEEGFLISYETKREVAADMNFLFVRSANQTYADLNNIYSLRLKSEAVRLLNKYDAGYILLSRRTMEMYGMRGLFYADPDCFEKAYDSGAIVYKFRGCRI